MEEKAVIFMSIDFAIARNKITAQAERLSGIAGELFKKHPNIAYEDYPQLYVLVKDFYANLKMEGERHDLQTRELYIYTDLLQKCEALIEKLRGMIKQHAAH